MELPLLKQNEIFYRPKVDDDVFAFPFRLPDIPTSIRDAENIGIGNIDLPSLNDLQTGLLGLQAQLEEGQTLLDAEISEPLKVIIREEIAKLKLSIEMQSRR